MGHRVTLIPGDGTGPELTEATRRVLEATGVALDWDVRQAGVEVMEEAGTPLPEETLASVKENGVALKGPITTPIGTGFRSVNVALRHELELFACLRPCKTYPGVRTRYDNVDIVVVRENTEDLYAGIEYEAGGDDAEKVIAIDKQTPRLAMARNCGATDVIGPLAAYDLLRSGAWEVSPTAFLVIENRVVIPVVARLGVASANNKLVVELTGWDNNTWDLPNWYREA